MWPRALAASGTVVLSAAGSLLDEGIVELLATVMDLLDHCSHDSPVAHFVVAPQGEDLCTVAMAYPLVYCVP